MVHVYCDAKADSAVPYVGMMSDDGASGQNKTEEYDRRQPVTLSSLNNRNIIQLNQQDFPEARLDWDPPARRPESNCETLLPRNSSRCPVYDANRTV